MKEISQTGMARARTALQICAAALLMAVSLGQTAQAASVTIDEAALDAIFSQASFGGNPIDVRIAATQVLVAPSYTDIDSSAESYGLLNSAGTGPQIDMFFVDSISACGNEIAVGMVGCGWIDQPGLYVESDYAAGANGSALEAHEISHNLGLLHTNSGLMNPIIAGDTTLTTSEVSTILSSSMVQSDGSGLFIEVVPWVVTGIAAVPLPASGVFLVAGLGALAGLRRRRRRRT